jgi:PAS domain S-box-containing protein
VRILVVDDHEAVRNAIRSLLRSNDKWTICGEASDGVEAVEKAKTLRPNLVLMDISMPKMDGMDATRIIREEVPDARVIIISQNDPKLVSRQASASGAQAFVPKAELGRHLASTIDSIMEAKEGTISDPNLVDAKKQGGERVHDPAEPYFRQALDALPAPVYMTDPDGRLTYFNSAAIEFSGHIPELGTDSWCVTWKLYRPDGTPLPHDKCPMAVALREGRTVSGEEAIAERPDGTRRWFAPFPTVIRNAHGKVVGGLNMLVDLTDRKREAQTNNLLAAIVDSSDDAIVSKTLNGIITSWNKSAERMFGYAAEEAIGRHISLIIPQERQDEEIEIISQLKKGGRIDHFDTIRQRKDGGQINVSLTISPVRDAAGQIVGASKVAREIGLRKKSEQRLAEAARRQRALFHLADQLHRATSSAEVYNASLNAICEALQCDQASVLLYDETRTMRFVAWRGLSDAYWKAVEGHSPWKPDEQDPEPVCIENLDDAPLDDDLRHAVKAEGIRSLAFIPIVCEGKLAGKFMTYFPEPHRFTDDQLSLSITISRQLAFAIERRRGDDALRQSEERLRSLSSSLEAEVQKRTRQLEERNAALVRRSEQVRSLSRQLLQAQDEERRHIARELHDSAGQTLTVLGMNLAQLQKEAGTVAADFAQQIAASEELVQQLHQEIRTTSYLLHPPLLDENGLASALAWYVEGLADRSNLNIQLNIPEDFGRIPRDIELVVFRTIQESVTNIHRHAAARAASIRLARVRGAVQVEVEDNGKGMSADKLAALQSGVAGVGIRGIRERISQFQGELKINSNESGTKVLVSIPICAPPDNDMNQQLPVAV